MTQSNWKQEQKKQNPLGQGFTYCGGTPDSRETEASFREKADLEKVQYFSLAMVAGLKSLASVGERLKIVQIQGSQTTVRRLNEMGLVQGSELEVLNLVNGSVIFSIGNNRLGLGAGMAQKVICTNI
jgi:ferrous iron transport protein A